MAFNASFQVQVTANPSTFRLIDDSTGSDPNLTVRTVYLYQANNELLVPPITWPISDVYIDCAVLQQDYALNIQVVWTSSSPEPDPSTYTYSQLWAFVLYGQLFLYQLTQNQTSNPEIVQDTDYYSKKMQLISDIDSALNCISVGEDIYGAQDSILRYQYLITNQNYYF